MVRVTKDSNGRDCKYYELRCADCGAKLAFGCNQDGQNLFPKLKDKDGNYLPNGGWVKWNRETGKEE